MSKAFLFYMQGALVGTISGLGLVCWMLMGQIFAQLGRDRLPSDISGCNTIDTNVTSSPVTTHNYISTTYFPNLTTGLDEDSDKPL